MPNLNRKGPEGNGTATGRNLGCCNIENKGKTREEILAKRELENLPTQRSHRGGQQGRRCRNNPQNNIEKFIHTTAESNQLQNRMLSTTLSGKGNGCGKQRARRCK